MFRLVVALLLALTLGWKIVLGLANSPVDRDDSKNMLIEFLERQHYAVTETNGSMDGLSVIKAAAGDCRLLISEIKSGGWNHDIVQAFAPANERVFFMFRGAIYTRPPTWLSVADHYWSRFLREIGVNHPDTPIFAVIASAHCDAERLPWHDFLRPT